MYVTNIGNISERQSMYVTNISNISERHRAFMLLI